MWNASNSRVESQDETSRFSLVLRTLAANRHMPDPEMWVFLLSINTQRKVMVAERYVPYGTNTDDWASEFCVCCWFAALQVETE